MNHPNPHTSENMPAPTDVAFGAEILDAVQEFVARFNAFPNEHCSPMLALWYAHTWIAEHLYVTPRLIVSSAEPGSGKTRVLEVAQWLCRASELTFSATSAALFRMVSTAPITILFDEVDAIFSAKAGGNEDLRALLNSGYKRGATIPRCKGDAANIVVERHPVYAPAALAGIAGGMPATITTRAITINLRKRRFDQKVEAYRERVMERESAPIREALTQWVTSVAQQVGESLPNMPEGVMDRAAEIWEPLLAIADIAGGHWPTTARAACTHFVNESRDAEPSIWVKLLADIRSIFEQERTDRMHTADLLAALLAIEESPWGDLWGKPLDARRLAKELARYVVRPTTVKINGTNGKGYTTAGETGLADAWARYLPQQNRGECQ